MIELFSLIAATEYFKNKERFNNNENIDFSNDDLHVRYFTTPEQIPMSWIIVMLLISFGTAYLAYACSEYEKPARRAVMTIIGFFFSGFYLIYYFIYHILLDRPCGSRSITNIVKNSMKK